MEVKTPAECPILVTSPTDGVEVEEIWEEVVEVEGLWE